MTRLTRIGMPTEVARHSDWDQIGKSFTAVRGIGYVTWYPVATEAANLSEGNSVFETVARWKAREVQASLKIKLSHSGEGTPATPMCNGKMGEDYKPTCKLTAHTKASTSVRSNLSEGPYPYLWVGQDDGLEAPALHISYIHYHRPGVEKMYRRYG